jgi:hypothetical protein
MLLFKKLQQLKPYYNQEINTYVFNDDVTFEFDLVVRSNINAQNINAKHINARYINALDIDAEDIDAWYINAGNINSGNIKSGDIKARHIKARYINTLDIDAEDIDAEDINACNINSWSIYSMDIYAHNINARDISYFAVCYAYDNITCTSIQGRKHNHKHFVLDGQITIKPKPQLKKKVTLELTDEQSAKIKNVGSYKIKERISDLLERLTKEVL